MQYEQKLQEYLNQLEGFKRQLVEKQESEVSQLKRIHSDHMETLRLEMEVKHNEDLQVSFITQIPKYHVY